MAAAPDPPPPARLLQVNVNGRWFHAFAHRMPVEYVSGVEIDGDVSVQTVDITEVSRRSPLSAVKAF